MTREEAVNDLNTIKEFFEQENGAYPVSLEYAIGVLKNGLSADRPQGEWKEKTKFHNADDDPIIEEWQSTKCSVCGKYHTTPYLYYFDDYNFCPNCGSRMRGGKDD